MAGAVQGVRRPGDGRDVRHHRRRPVVPLRGRGAGDRRRLSWVLIPRLSGPAALGLTAMAGATPTNVSFSAQARCSRLPLLAW